jgi:hypothetical protein
MRRGELFELCWTDIDFYNKIITVRSSKNGRHPTIPLNEMAENVLTAHAQSETKSNFVFPGRGGKKRTECKRPLLRIRKKAGLPEDFRLLQGLRHVYASMLVSSGKVDLETLQSLLTQKSPLMTQRYAHLLDQAVDFTDTEIATDSTDSEIATDSTDSEIATDSTDSEIATNETETEIATDYTDTEIATDFTDTEPNKEVPETVVATDSTDSVELEEILETESDSKTPELSQLVKQNYSAVTAEDRELGKTLTTKIPQVENKNKQKIRPSLSDLKNDLRSLSELIQAAPQRSKIFTPKRNQS